MTGRQVRQAIKLTLDKYSASTSAVIGPAFLDEELCAFANQAMLEIICTKFTGNNQLQQGFEQSVKRVADLERLIVASKHTLTRYGTSNRYITAPSSFDGNATRLFLVSATVGTKDSKNNEVLFPAELTDRQTVSRFLQTPTNRPWIPVPKLITFQTYDDTTKSPKKGIAVYIDPDMIDKYGSFDITLEYVVQPTSLGETGLENIAFGNVFPDPVLYEIIDRAALLALDNIESQRVETKAALNKMQE